MSCFIRFSFYIGFFFICITQGYSLEYPPKVDSLISELGKLPEDSNKVKLYNRIGKELLSISPSEAGNFFTQSIQLSEKLKYVSGLSNACKLKGTSFYYLANLDSTEFYWKKNVQISRQLSEKKLGDALNNMGVLFLRKGEIDSSIAYNQKALLIRKQIEDTLAQAMSLSNLGSIYRTKGELQKALENYLNALRIYEKLHRSKQISDALNSIGLVYMGLRDYEKSLNYLKKSLDIREEIGDIRGKGNCLNNIAGVYELKDDFGKAEKYYQEYLRLSEKMGNRRGIAGALSNLGNIYKNSGDYEKSKQAYLQANLYFRELKDPEGLAITYNNLGIQETVEENFSEAIVYFDSALAYSRSSGSLELELTSAKWLSNNYEAIENYRQALEYGKLYLALNDSMFSIKTAEKIAELQELYNAEKKALEIETLRKDAVIKQQQAEKDRQFRNWAIGASILLLAVLMLVYNQARLRRKLFMERETLLEKEKEEYQLISELKQKEVDVKSRELSTYATNVLEKQELLSKIKNKLEQIKFGEVQDSRVAINNLNQLIQNNMNLDSQWDDFKKHFEGVHPNFFNRLLSKYPNLNSNDLKNCAYIKMHLSSKEVASLLNIDPKSVKVLRSRLKKKLDLETKQDLDSFILSF